MTQPVLLDLFSGAGGCAVGYSRAGFRPIGVDIVQQKRYPFEFHQDDALHVLRVLLAGEQWNGYRLGDFAAIHASPPCQAFSALKAMWPDRHHEDLIGPTRELLRETRLPYIIENVPGAPLKALLMLCGTMFGLRCSTGAELRRHRYFETNWFPGMVRPCSHGELPTISVHGGTDYFTPRTITVAGNSGGASRRDSRHFGTVEDRREAMGIDWMTSDELSQAIPPAYTEFIGHQLRRHLS